MTNLKEEALRASLEPVHPVDPLPVEGIREHYTGMPAVLLALPDIVGETDIAAEVAAVLRIAAEADTVAEVDTAEV